MDTKTVVHGKLCVEVGELRFGDERRFRVLSGKLAEFSPLKDLKGDSDDYALMLEYDLVKFAYAVAQTRSSSGFELPAATDDPAVIYAAFESVDNLPGAFVKGWFNTAAALRAPVDQDLAPADHLTADQKKAKASAKKE